MLNTIDLFVGCGGLSEGFEQSRKYKMIGAVEWEPSPVKELRNHLKNRWGIQDSEERVLQFDIQRTEELFNGWKDKKFGESKGLDALVGNRQLDVIIGGPPCQAYSVAGRMLALVFALAPHNRFVSSDPFNSSGKSFPIKT